ncbi:MAG TPA: hypothetical protein VMD53_13305 [Rhizomicrobium sp.]|nr:hypothetical protein [Rhizomicrobium sp.]
MTAFIAAAIAAGGPALSAGAAKKTTTIRVSACIDGRDALVIQGGNLVWRNISADPVGVRRDECPTNATTISAFAAHDAPAAPISWIPTYDGDGADSDSGAVSSLSPTFDPGLPSRDVTLNVSATGHGYVVVRQRPTVDNAYQLVVEIDNADPRPSMFTVTIAATEK